MDGELNMKKTLTKIFCIAVLLSCLTGCFESKEEKQKRQSYYDQAKENTISYIQKKYGFTPEAGTTKCTFDNSDNFSNNCTGMILVNAKYNDKSFEVLIDGTNSTESGIDNYQYEQISREIVDLITSDYGVPYKYQLYYGYDNKGLIAQYYDGNNLSDVMRDNYLRLVAEYIDSGFSEVNKESLKLSKFSIFHRLYIVNYKSLNTYKKIKNHNYNITGSYIENEFYDNSEYLKNVITLNVRDVKYYDF